MQLSHKYEVERMELKQKIAELRERLNNVQTIRQSKENFTKAVRKFLEMQTLTAPLLHELIERIDVYQTEGTGKNRTQRIVIHYRFIGYLELPEAPEYEQYTLDSREGVAIRYMPSAG